MKKKPVRPPVTRSLHPKEYELVLYVTGASPNSIRAITNVRQICSQYLAGRHSLQIIDVYQHPELAIDKQIYVLPVLVRKRPLPERKFIGDLSETDKVIKGLGLQK